MSASDGPDLCFRFLREAEAQIHEDHLATNWNQMIHPRSKYASQPALNGPGECRNDSKNNETNPHRPVLRKPETGLFAGSAHARIKSETRCGRAADSVQDRCTS